MIRIAIDGPGGAGKSSLAKAVASRMGIVYVDTGALYRTVGTYMLSHGISTSDTKGIIEALCNIHLEMKFENGKQIILLNGSEVGEEIRTPEASMAASAVSAIGEVRDFLLSTQRSIAEHTSVIMDGRDIGTVILPHAEVKIFLTASPEARARRRYNELAEKGIKTTYEQVYAEMQERDKNDSSRAIAPCVPAADAVMLDNSNLSAEETVDAVINIVKNAEKMRSSKGTGFYRFIKNVLTPFFRFFGRMNIIGKENIPKSGGAIIACNHIGVLDVFLLSAVFPRQIYYLSKKEWFSVPVLKNLIKALGAIPLDRGGKDVGALKHAIDRIKEGKQIAIFPQGHRYPGINPSQTVPKNGVSLIAYKAHADVIPVCIKTKDVKYRFLRKIDVIIGKPIPYSDLGFTTGGSEEYRQATARIFSEICALGGYNLLSENQGESK